MKKWLMLLILVIMSVSAFCQITYTHNRGIYGQVWFDSNYEKSHSTIADYDTSSIVLKNMDGIWAIMVYNSTGAQTFYLDPQGNLELTGYLIDRGYYMGIT